MLFVSDGHVPRGTPVPLPIQHATIRPAKATEPDEGLTLASPSPTQAQPKSASEYLRHFYSEVELPKTIGEGASVDKYQLGRQIGTGGFSKVYEGVDTTTGQKVAVKVVLKNECDEEQLAMINNETAVWSRVRHANVVRLYHVFHAANALCIVSEIAEGGNLLDFIIDHPEGMLSEHEAKPYFKQLFNVVAACHQKGVVHGDIKPDNILLTQDKKTIKLCDFGLSYIDRAYTPDTENATDYFFSPGSSGMPKSSSFSGTPLYLAPEVIKIAPTCGSCSDMWSVGVTLFAALTGRYPFDDDYEPRLQDKILRHDFEMPSELSQDCQDLLRRLLAKDPLARISADNALKHPWFCH